MTSIALYCDRGHAREDIGCLVHHDALGAGWSLEHPATGYRRDLTKMTQILDESGRITTTIGAPAERIFTRRYRLSCGECDTRTVVLDQEPLWECLATLAERGVAELRLTELAAALRYRAEH